MGYLDYLKHGGETLLEKGKMPVYLAYFITDARNAKCKHRLLADGAHPGWEEPSMLYPEQELSLEEIDEVTASVGKDSLMFLLPTGGAARGRPGLCVPAGRPIQPRISQW